MDIKSILELLVAHLRTLHLYYHNCHHVAFGPTFVQDHELFQQFYETFLTDYDDVSERTVGYYGRASLDLESIMRQVQIILSQLPKPSQASVDEMLAGGLLAEKELCKICEVVDKTPEASSGLRQLLGDIANRSEVRQYKIQQRLEK